MDNRTNSGLENLTGLVIYSILCCCTYFNEKAYHKVLDPVAELINKQQR